MWTTEADRCADCNVQRGDHLDTVMDPSSRNAHRFAEPQCPCRKNDPGAPAHTAPEHDEANAKLLG